MAFNLPWNKKPKPTKNLTQKQSYEIFSPYNSFFSDFGNDIYKSAIVRSCIRPIAEGTSKLNVQVYRERKVRDDTTGFIRKEIVYDDANDRLQSLISDRPNAYMNGKDFLYKVRTLYEIHNNAFIFVDKDDYGNVIGLYPIPYNQIEIKDYAGEIFFVFTFAYGQTLVGDLSNIAILRKDYAENLLFGETNTGPLQQPLQLIHTSNEGTMNTIKTSTNIRGLLKSTKAMLSDKDREALRDNFVNDYITLENESGVAVVDSTMDYTPLSVSGKILDAEQTREQREDIYRYFGVNDAIIMNKFDSMQWESFYEGAIEPFALALGLELTNKVFTDRERGFGNKIIFAGNRLLYISTAQKLQFASLVDRGEMTPNEHRALFGLPPVPGGDQLVRRKEYGEIVEEDINVDNSEVSEEVEGVE